MASGQEKTISTDRIRKENQELRDSLERKDRELRVEGALDLIRSRSMLMQHSDEIKSISEIFHKQLLLLGIPSEFSYVWLPDEANHTHQFWASWSAGEDAFQSKQVTYPLDKSEPYTAACFNAWETPDIILEEFISTTEIVGFFDVWSELLEGAENLKAGNFPEGIYYSEAYMKYGCFGINIRRKLTSEEKHALKRFSTEFERAYTRFLDLKKAENQAFEARLETALEKVRSRTMAMQSSEELPEVANIMFLEIQALDIPAWSCGYCILLEDGKSSTCIMSSEGTLQKPFLLPHHGEKSFKEWDTFIQSDKEFFTQELKDEAIISHYEFMKSLPHLGSVFQELQDAGLSLPEYQINHLCKFDHGFLLFITYEEVPDAHIIFQRFTAVFNQTYTRFLDLQKAEAQALEAQIEAALERVRSASMAMHQTSELREVISTIFGQLKVLNVSLDACYIDIFEPDNWGLNIWVGTETNTYPEKLTVSYLDHPLFNRTKQARLEKESFFTLRSDKDAKDKLIRHLASESDIVQERLDLMLQGDSVDMSVALSEHAALNVYNYRGRPYSEEQNEIVRRFSRVFEQAYTRFLDLQKAEAQAREARIETALEKVRARTMGMQKSDELADVANILFEELNELVHNLWTCGFVLCEKDRTEDEWWLGLDDGFTRGFFLPNVNDYAHAHLYEGWLKEEAFRTVQLEGDDLQEHYDWLMEIPVAKNIFDEMEAAGMERPEWQKLHAAYFSKGYLVIITREPCAEESIFKRFAQVFDLTYTRFLDLKKAEAQARESQIELSLERIRARVTAMQESSDLLEIVVSMRSEFVNLGHEAHYFWHMRWNPETYSKAMTSGDGSQIGMVMTLPRHIHGDIPPVAEWEKGSEPVHVLAMETETAVDYVDKMIKLGDFERVDPQAPTLDDIRHIGGLTFIMARTTHGEIGYSLPGVVPNPPIDAVDTLVRFAGVFDLAYRRFEDLKKSEVRTREARIELALERIRAEVASMQESSDLFDIVVSMRKEFLELGHEADYFWHMRWLPESYEMSMTSEDGSRIGMAITLPKFVHDEIVGLAEWEKGKDPYYVLPLDTEGAWSYLENMDTHGDYQLADPNAPQKKDIEEIGGLTFIMARTSHGEIGYSLAGMVPEPPEDALDTLVRFAGVFDLAYKRFEDLKSAERQALMIKEERDRLEEALTELRATQTQLIQQEKLASLGQLTAGIAHEIKNPLNFVNNFSEVSLELIDEALNEIREIKENNHAEEASEILSDVQFNLKKIHEHGTRANGIVSSMLQHSRGGSGKMEPTDLNALIQEYVNLSFHGMRAGKNPINVDIQLDLDKEIGQVNLIGEDFSRVILNLCNNAFDAMREKAKTATDYLPVLSVKTRLAANSQLLIAISDNGPGIPDDLKDKIMQPFFTTKKGTEGTGLGLSITNDIIKAHGGEMKINSNAKNGTTFSILIRTK